MVTELFKSLTTREYKTRVFIIYKGEEAPKRDEEDVFTYFIAETRLNFLGAEFESIGVSKIIYLPILRPNIVNQGKTIVDVSFMLRASSLNLFPYLTSFFLPIPPVFAGGCQSWD